MLAPSRWRRARPETLRGHSVAARAPLMRGCAANAASGPCASKQLLLAPSSRRKIDQMKFYQKPTCTTCRKAKKWLSEQGLKPEEVDLNQGLSEAELDALIGKRDYTKFLNFRNELYREKKMKINPPSREEAIRLMSKHPNLIRRPILVNRSKIALGFDEQEFREVAGL
jgi:arsenate reductase